KATAPPVWWAIERAFLTADWALSTSSDFLATNSPSRVFSTPTAKLRAICMSQSLRGLAFGRSLALLFLGFWSGITVTAAPRLFQLSLGGFLRVGLAHRLGERAEAAFVRI